MSGRGLVTAITVLMALGCSAAGAAVTVVTDGKAQAVIVLPAEANQVEKYAARELVYHVEKGSGVRLSVVSEAAVPAEPPGRVLIGKTAAAAAEGIDVAHMPLEAFVLRTTANALFVVGEDTEGDPLMDETHCGTLWGVYEVLDRFLGVRWLWPGELGVCVPRTDSVIIGELDEMVLPTMIQRRVRDGLVRPAGDTGLTEAGFERYSREQRVFQRRHRMGRSLPLSYGHAFPDWWQKYGAEHPEWFQLLPDGRRGPAPGAKQTSMCVSEPSLHRKIIDEWKRVRAGGKWANVNGCENDIRGLCTCENCLAWDGPQPDLSGAYPLGEYRMLSDRYAMFWLTLQEMGAEVYPDAMVMGYAYLNYFPAPTSGIRLNRNILVGYCPWPGFWYPRTDREQQWLEEQWDGWCNTGANMFWRPNHFLDGYTMPQIFAHQFAEEFQHYARHGMVATDFDSLTAQWAAQGTNLYLLFRLHARPDRPVDELLGEYYSAFGPAAEQVRRYFDYWEDYTMSDRDRFDRAQQEAGVSRYRQTARFAYAVFPPEVFEPAEKILGQAAGAAVRDPTCAARVEFLRKGLEHAKMCARLSALMAAGDSASREAARGLMDEIVAFRRATEGDFIANYDHCAAVEERSWQ